MGKKRKFPKAGFLGEVYLTNYQLELFWKKNRPADLSHIYNFGLSKICFYKDGRVMVGVLFDAVFGCEPLEIVEAPPVVAKRLWGVYNAIYET